MDKSRGINQRGRPNFTRRIQGAILIQQHEFSSSIIIIERHLKYVIVYIKMVWNVLVVGLETTKSDTGDRCSAGVLGVKAKKRRNGLETDERL